MYVSYAIWSRVGLTLRSCKFGHLPMPDMGAEICSVGEEKGGVTVNTSNVWTCVFCETKIEDSTVV